MRSPAGLVGAVALLKKHLDDSGLSAVQQAQVLSRAFGGGQSSSAIMTLVNNLSVLQKKQEQITKSMGGYGAAVAAQRQTVQAQLDILRSSVETIGVRMGLALLPPFIKLVRYLAADVIPGILKIGGILGGVLRNPFGGAFLAGLVAAAVAIAGIVKLMKVWEGITALLDAEEGIAAMLGPVGLTIVAVAALAAGIAVLWERSSTFRKIVEGAFRAVETAAKDVWNWIKGHWKLLAVILLAPFAPVIAAGYALYKLVEIVIHVFDSIKNAITGGFDGWWKSHGKELEEVWHAVWSTISAIFRYEWGPIAALAKGGLQALADVFKVEMEIVSTIWRIGWGALSAVVRAVWDVISGAVKAAWAVIAGVVKIGVAGVESVIKIAWDLIVGIFTVALDLVTGHWSKAWTDMQNTVTQVWNAIKEFLSAAWSAIEQAAVAWWNAMIGGVKSGAEDLIGYVRTIPGMILAALGDVGHLLWNAGVSIIKGLIGGITSMIGSIGHAIGNVVSTIKSFLPFSPAKQGPLSGAGDPYYSGLSIGKKIAAGITASLPAIKSAVKGSVGEINSALAKAATEKASGTTGLAGLDAHEKSLEKERAKEESQIQKLIAERAKEYAASHKGSEALRKEQEAEIQSLEKLRKEQESGTNGVKQTEKVIETLKKSMTELKDTTDKLKTALEKATKAAAKAASASSSSADDTSSADSSSSSDAPPDWTNFGQWMAATAGPGQGAGDGGSWRGYPGPLSGFGLGFQSRSVPGMAGRFDGAPPIFGGQGGDQAVVYLARMVDQLDQANSTLRAQPGKNAAGMAAAMNGVTGTSILRGSW